MESIRTAKAHGKFVAINYLNCPGFTDSEHEVDALVDFIQDTRIDMIQWRNLNFDPIRYTRLMDGTATNGKPLGMVVVINRLSELFPGLIHGYFNPPVQGNQRPDTDHDRALS